MAYIFRLLALSLALQQPCKPCPPPQPRCLPSMRSAGFLNKKTWHPGRIDNQEKVWKKEEDARKESSRLEDLRTQLEEERQHEELLSVAQAAGHKL